MWLAQNSWTLWRPSIFLNSPFNWDCNLATFLSFERTLIKPSIFGAINAATLPCSLYLQSCPLWGFFFPLYEHDLKHLIGGSMILQTLIVARCLDFPYWHLPYMGNLHHLLLRYFHSYLLHWLHDLSHIFPLVHGNMQMALHIV